MSMGIPTQYTLKSRAFNGLYAYLGITWGQLLLPIKSLLFFEPPCASNLNLRLEGANDEHSVYMWVCGLRFGCRKTGFSTGRA